MQRTSKPARGVGRLVLGLVVALVAAGPAAAQHGAPANGEWPTYGGDLGSTKYAPLDQIDRENFGDLEIAWRWQSADAVLSLTMPDGSEWRADSRLIFAELNRRDPERWRDGQAPTLTNLKATPLMVGDRLFINMPTSAAAAVDARTGETLWVFNPKSYEEGTTTMSARWNQRGVAYWSNGPDRTDERIFFGTGNGYLVCVDAGTGRPCADFGDGGRLDLMEGIPRSTRGERDWLNALLYSVQSPPIVFGNTVVTPMSISSYNNRKEMPPGWMRGFDVRSGRTRWTFHTIPQGDEFGNETWGGDSWRETGKVGVWTMMSIDPELGYIYLPLNTAAPHRLLRRTPPGRQPVRREPRRPGPGDRRAGLAFPDGPPRTLGLRPARRPEPDRHHRGRPADQGGGADHQAGLHVRLRPGDRRAGLADRGAPGGDRHRHRG